MQLHPRVKVLVLEKGYKSLAEFSKDAKVSYQVLNRLNNNKARSIDVKFLLTLCEKLDCQISDLLVVKESPKEPAKQAN